MRNSTETTQFHNGKRIMSHLFVTRKNLPKSPKPSQEEAEEAVRVLIRYAGDDISREGLRSTPARVIRAYQEWFGGYQQDPAAYLANVFSESNGYDEMVILRDIHFISHCEHHMAAIVGKAHIGYLPNGKLIGISKLARLVDHFARRLQLQERMTMQIADCLYQGLEPRGVGVVLEAIHHCMAGRGVNQQRTKMITRKMLGEFAQNETQARQFLTALIPASPYLD